MDRINLAEGEDLGIMSHNQGALCQELWKLRTEGFLCDLVIIVGGETLYAHRIVLSACSAYLRMYCLYPTTVSHDGLAQLRLENYSFKGCMKMLEYLYTGKAVELEGADRMEFKRMCAEWHISERTESSAGDSSFNRDLSPEKTEENSCESSTVSEEITPVVEEGPQLKQPKRGRKRKPPTQQKESDIAREDITEKVETNENNFSLTGDWTESQDDDVDMMNKIEELYNDETDNEAPDVPDDDDDGHDDDADDDLTQKVEIKKSDDDDNWTPEVRVKRTKKARQNYKEPIEKEKKQSTSGRTRRKRVARKAAIANSEEVNLTCHICGDEFESKIKLRTHRKTQHYNKQGSWCAICKSKFPDKNQYLAHNVEYHWREGMPLPRLYQCPVEGCKYHTYKRKSYSAHKLFGHQTEPSICDICGKSLKTAASLKQHKHFVHEVALSKEYPCDMCEKIFKSVCGLQRHKATIHIAGTEREKMICPHCGLTCLNKTTMVEHMYKKHDTPPPPGKTGYQCKYCDFKTVRIREMKNHDLRHLPEKQFACDICPKRYPTQRELNRHKLMHKGTLKVFRCPHCDYSTKYSNGALQAHIQVKHQEGRPWVCTICSYRCKLKGNLHKHIRNVHKCEVKTRWTLPKVVEGGCSDRYLTSQGGSNLANTEASSNGTEAVDPLRSMAFPAVDQPNLVAGQNTDMNSEKFTDPVAPVQYDPDHLSVPQESVRNTGSYMPEDMKAPVTETYGGTMQAPYERLNMNKVMNQRFEMLSAITGSQVIANMQNDPLNLMFGNTSM